MNINKNFLNKPFVPYVFLILFGFLIYFKTLFFQLTYLDDNVWILDYHWYLKDIGKAWKLFIEPDNFVSEIFYRPLIILTFMTDAAIGGTSIFVYHLTNILIHIISACLVLALFVQLGYERKLSIVCAFIFISHPIMTQAVAWIPGRTDSLLALFALASFVNYLSFLKTKRILNLLFHFVFFICALLTKETAIVLPVMFFMYYFLIARKQQELTRQRYVFIGWVIMTVVWYVSRKMILSGAPGLQISVAVKSVVDNLPAILVYLGKVIFPINLSVLPILEDSTLVYGIIALIVMAIFFFMEKQKRLNYVFFGLFWFVIFILPGLVISFLFHEYRIYLPIIGIMIVVLEITGIKKLVLDKRKFMLSMSFLILCYGLTSFIYSHQYKDQYSFWESAVETSPHSPLAHRNLGAMYHLDGEIDLAEGEYLKALELNEREFMVNNNLGLISVKRKQYKQAEQFYLKEIAINPTYENVYFNLGLLYFGAGRREEAVQLWEKTIELNPRYLAAYKYLIINYSQSGNKEQTQYYLDVLKKMGAKVVVKQ